MAREPVTLFRTVEATLIPQGEKVLLPEGAWLIVQQSLGGAFTLMNDRGQLLRIDGVDADALGRVSRSTRSLRPGTDLTETWD